MTATVATPRKFAAPGSAPPIRAVTDDEIRANTGLVHHVLNRMRRRGELVAGLEYEDIEQVGMLALWEALRRWEPAKGARSTYCSSYIWGYVMKHQRDVTRADGFNRKAGEKIAHVVSYEETIVEDMTLRDTLASPADTEHEACAAALWRNAHERVEAMSTARQAVGRRILADLPTTDVASELGVSKQRVSQIARSVREQLVADQPVARTGVLLVCRELHASRGDAIREAARVRPGCKVIDCRPRKVRGGRVVAPQGRAAADGRLGRPVWAITVEAA